MGDTSLVQEIGEQISPLEAKGRALPYVELRSNAKTLYACVKRLRTLIADERFYILIANEFEQAYEDIYCSEMAKYHSDNKASCPFELKDYGFFNDELSTIEKELEQIQEPVRLLKKHETEIVAKIDVSLVRIMKSARSIITRTDQRIETMTTIGIRRRGGE
ncbi:MAG: hypothetical protein NWE92_03475 [Candidatus Bathyarchaeota archaeon]|nr:hypothetical protein [Candidatus Bathyarchaeota archaeon]